MFIRRFHLIGLLVLCFLIGAVTGTVYESLATDGSAKRRVRMSEIVAQLDLSVEQKKRLDKVLEDGRTCMVDLNKTYRPEFDAVKKRMRVGIQEILTPQQREAFDRMMAEQEKKRSHYHRSHSSRRQTE